MVSLRPGQRTFSTVPLLTLSCSYNSPGLHSPHHSNNRQDVLLFQIFLTSESRTHCSDTITTVDSISGHDAVSQPMSHSTLMIFKPLGPPRFRCSVPGKRSHMLRCHPPIMAFSRVSFISFSDYILPVMDPPSAPKNYPPPPHRTSFSARHLTHSLPNGDGVCPDDDIKTPHQPDSASPQPPHSPSS